MSFSIDSVDTASSADDNTRYTIWKNKCEVENKLKIASVKLFKRFYKNGMKANQEKCNFLSCLHITRELSLRDCSVQNSSSEKFLKLIIDSKLNFNENVTNLCNKATKKIQALARIFPNMPVTLKENF